MSKRTIKLFLVVSDWVSDGECGHDVEVFTDKEAARKKLSEIIATDKLSHFPGYDVPDSGGRYRYGWEETETFWDIWLVGRYCEYHSKAEIVEKFVEIDSDKLEIPLTDKISIKAEVYHDEPEFPPELSVYLDNDGVVWQDLGLVRPAYTISEDGDILSHQDAVDVLVWSDETAEDYTHQFIIPVYKDEDAPPETEAMPEEVIEYLNEEDRKNG